MKNILKQINIDQILLKNNIISIKSKENICFLVNTIDDDDDDSDDSDID